MQEIMQRDFIVIGSGIAGLTSALTLATYGKVLIITKQKINSSSTFFAQGGIAAVTKKDDSMASHIDDTLNAGYHHNKKQAVDFLVKNGQSAVDRLIDYGVPFDKQDGDYVTSYEAAHSYPRILHATDFTGQEIQKALMTKVLDNANIEIWENTSAIDLFVKKNVCYGVQVLKRNKVIELFSRCVVLATGGAGQLYQWTTNPEVSTGDGIAIAKRAGADLSDLEFIQFHPTALKGSKTSQLFLLSEALRGEGAYLVDQYEHRFMQDIHPLAELAPRDVVARAIFEKQQTGDVFIDLRHKTKTFLKKRFPKISAELTKRGFDLSLDLIPVTPAAHFICGGVATDMYGRTSVGRLFAYGEVAATGVHGANRLASNSLLEAVVFSNQIRECIDELPTVPQVRKFSENITLSNYTSGSIVKQIRQIMWEYVGITRTTKGLEYALQQFKILERELKAINGTNAQLLEVKNILTVSIEITKAASQRQHSLGTHSFINA